MDFIINNSSALVEIFVLVTVFYSIIVYLLYKYNKEGLRQNWKNNRCNPLYMPLAGLYDEKGIGFGAAIYENFMNCYWNLTKEFFKILLRPFMYALNIVKNIIRNFYKVIDRLRNQLNKMRNFFLRIAIGVMDRMTNLMSAFIFKFHKIRDTIKRFFAIYKVMLHMIKSISLFFTSAKDGPIGDGARFTMKWAPTMVKFVVGPFSNDYPKLTCPNSSDCCFTGDTNILLNNNKVCAIKDIKVGDLLKNNSKVTCIMIFKSNDTNLYNISEGYVTGSHLININNRWKRVNNVLNKCLYKKTDYVYCLNTSDNLIHTKYNTFRDYNELSGDDDIRCKKLIYNSLNNFDVKNVKIPNYDAGLTKEILIKYLGIDFNCDFKELINKNSNISGFMVIDGSNIDMYNYKGIIISGANIVYENKKWVYVSNSSFSEKTDIKYKYLYNIVTKDNNIYINDIITKDFVCTKNNFVNNLCDCITDYLLNN